MAGKKVLSVGQCGMDHASLRWSIGQAYDVELVPAATAADALGKLKREQFALVLVNRIFDADGTSGVQFIEQLKQSAEGSDVPVMLVSNYADAQELATKAGAVPGFGKGSLGDPAVAERLAPYLGEGGS